MKMVLISDLHANPVSVEGILRKERPWDQLVCLGDYLDQGHHPEDLITLMRSNSHLGVPGNHDFHLMQAAQSRPNLRSSVISHNELSTFAQNGDWNGISIASLSGENWQWFSELCAGPRFHTFEMDEWIYIIAHCFSAEWINAKDANLVRAEYYVPEGKGDMVDFIKDVTGSYDPESRYRVCTGHRHYRWHLRLSDNLEYVNPGSTAYMRKGEEMRGAEYVVVQDGNVFLKHYEYDWERFYSRGVDGQYDGCHPLTILEPRP